MSSAPVAAAHQIAREHFFRANALREQQRDAEALAELRAAIQVDPCFAEAYVNLGYHLVRAGNVAEAEAAYARAIALRPDLPEAHFNLGEIQVKLGTFDLAIDSFQRALAFRPAWAEAYLNLACAHRSRDELEAADAACLRALAIKPDFAEAWTDLANIYRAQNRTAEALTSAGRAIALAPNSPPAHINLGMAYLVSGELRAGWPHAEYRQKLFGDWSRSFAQPQWTGRESLTRKSILLHAEQGLGDTIQFLRYVPQVAALGATVYLEVQPALYSLVRSAMPETVSVFSYGDPLPEFEFHCPLPSLPLAFDTEIQTIPKAVPYLGVPSEYATVGRDILRADRLQRVGFAWSGNPAHPNDRNRSLPLATFARALSPSASARYFSLKKELWETDAATLASLPEVANLAPLLANLAATAAIIAQLDLVITVDTAVAHLAGAMGKPVWILLPFSPDWRWMLDREDSPWYPTARLFRQPRPGDWHSVIDRIRAELEGACGT